MALTDALDTVLDKTFLGYTRLGPAVRRQWWPSDPRPDALADHHVVVTGGSSGLGRATAAGLARLGAEVHLVGRSLERLEAAAGTIRTAVPDARLRCEECDVSDLDAARSYGRRLVDEVGAVHALVHDAGVMPPQRSESAQGHETALATHVIGPIALTEAVRPALAAAESPRVVVVSSGGMYSAPMDQTIGDDVEYREGEYEGIRAYARTKRIQVVMAEELAERYRRDGIVVHSMHPGWADTPGVTDSLPRFATIAGPTLRTAEQGADTIVWLAAAEDPTSTTGLFWCDRRPRPTSYLPWQHDDPEARAKVWSYVTDAAGIS